MLELRLRHKDGTWLPLLLRGTFTGDKGGKDSIDCVVVDITEQKRMMLTGITNIRDVIPFPRTPGNLEF